MRVLVTRPLEDAQEIAARLRACGHEALVAPLLEICFRDGPEIVFDGVQAILATSANGVRALSRRTDVRDIPIYAVGPQTAAEARRLGFVEVGNAQGDAAALAGAVAGWATPGGGVLLHAAGAETRGDLAARLVAKSFTVRTETLYDAVAVAALPKPVSEALRANRLDAVLLFSPRSARIFAELVAAAGLAGSCSRLFAACISQAAAVALGGLKFKDVRIAAVPNQASLLACLD